MTFSCDGFASVNAAADWWFWFCWDDDGLVLEASFAISTDCCWLEADSFIWLILLMGDSGCSSCDCEASALPDDIVLSADPESVLILSPPDFELPC